MCLKPRKALNAEVVLVMSTGDRTSHAGLARRGGLGRGQRARHRSTRNPPGTWEALSSPLKNKAGWVPAEPRSRPAARGRPRTAGANEEDVQAVTVRARATEPGGMGGRDSESSIVPMKAGNLPDGTRWREGGSDTRNRRRERCRDHRISVASQRDFDG